MCMCVLHLHRTRRASLEAAAADSRETGRAFGIMKEAATDFLGEICLASALRERLLRAFTRDWTPRKSFSAREEDGMLLCSSIIYFFLCRLGITTAASAS